MNNLSRFYGDRRRYIDNMYSTFNDLMDEFTKGPGPAMDIKDTDDAYIATVEAPGLRKDEIILQIENGVLYLSATQKTELEEDEGKYIRRGRSQRSFTESFSLKNVKEDEVTANYEDGLLTITLPKQDKGQSKIKSIEIK